MGEERTEALGEGVCSSQFTEEMTAKKVESRNARQREEEGMHPVRYEAIQHARELVPVNTQNHSCD